MQLSTMEIVFRTSSYCNTGTCVAVALTREGVAVRDNKAPDAGQLTVGRPAWTAFLANVPTVNADEGR